MADYVLGIDFGSTTGKAVILDETGAIRAAQVSQKGAVSDEGVKAALAAALGEAGLSLRQIARTVATGYGRRMLDIADRTITEITCHARGAVHMVPEARMVIDIGGQDSKVIAIDPNGLVAQFAMNDRCAAGTGKFLETLARAVNVAIDDMGPLALRATQKLTVSSMCATFAETEVIALLAEGHPEGGSARRGARGDGESDHRPRRAGRQTRANRDDGRRRPQSGRRASYRGCARSEADRPGPAANRGRARRRAVRAR